MTLTASKQGDELAFDEHAIDTRMFVVGCSRSGTTLLQSLIASHPDISTFPETNFFWETLAHAPRRKHLIRWGLSSGREMAYLKSMLERFARKDLASLVPPQPWLFQTSVDAYLAVLDRLANEQAASMWVEKTPLHIHYIDTIEGYVPSPLFIHIVRDGREVVASIKDRAQKYPDRFGGQSIDYGIRMWNRCLQDTLSHMGKAHHHIVLYDRLVEETDQTMQELGKFIGVRYTPEMQQRRRTSFDELALSKERWKEKVAKPIRRRPSKFNKIFDDQEKAYITRNLSLGDMEKIIDRRNGKR